MSCHALLAYEGSARDLVARIKYRNTRGSLAWLSRAMASILPPLPTRPGSVQPVVTWAPTTTARRRQRGFDHAELLARAVARELGVPCVSLLQRGTSSSQTGRTRADRLAGPSFHAAPGRSAPTTVVLVDDVVTTGATLSAAARALRAEGVSDVVGLVAARAAGGGLRRRR